MSSIDAFLSGEKVTRLRDRLLGQKAKPRSVVAHDPIDDMALGISKLQCPTYRTLAVDEPPLIPPNVQPPEDIDHATATPEEEKAWREAELAYRRALDETVEYDPWEDLTDDIHRALHHRHAPEIAEEADVHTDVSLHPDLMDALVMQKEFQDAWRLTRGDRLMTELTVCGMASEARELLEDKLSDRARQQEDKREKREEAEQTQQDIENLLPPDFPVPLPGGSLPGGEDGGTQVPGDGEHEGGHEDDPENGAPGEDGTTQDAPSLPEGTREQVEDLIRQREEQLEEAEAIADAEAPIDRSMLDAAKAVAEAARDAAEQASHLPRFGAGAQAGEPVYSSPERALEIAKIWGDDPKMRAIAERFGRFDPDIRFRRAKRHEGGQDEIVDVEFGDNLKRVLPSELSLLSDGVTEDLFFARYANEELLQFATVGEAHAGRGPILMVLDGSQSMTWDGGQRNIYARALALCLLHIARLEKRDFACVEFAAQGQLKEWRFPAKTPMDGELVLDMASHIFSGGTQPIQGVARAKEIMAEAPAFKKADVVLVGDGDAPFGAEDEALRDALAEMGVRLFGMAVGPELGDASYLHKYCEHVVKVQDFELDSPSAATAELATKIT